MERMPPTVLVLVAVCTVQVGAALAKTLFDEIGAGGTVFLCVAAAALVLALVWRQGSEATAHAISASWWCSPWRSRE